MNLFNVLGFPKLACDGVDILFIDSVIYFVLVDHVFLTLDTIYIIYNSIKELMLTYINFRELFSAKP